MRFLGDGGETVQGLIGSEIGLGLGLSRLGQR